MISVFRCKYFKMFSHIPLQMEKQKGKSVAIGLGQVLDGFLEGPRPVHLVLNI